MLPSWFWICCEVGIQDDGALLQRTGLPEAETDAAREERFETARDYLLGEKLIEWVGEPGGELRMTFEGNEIISALMCKEPIQ